MKKWQVWSEGYAAQGNDSDAILHGEFEAETFQEACDKAFENAPRRKYLGKDTGTDYDRERLSYWGCKLFDNEQDARKSFG